MKMSLAVCVLAFGAMVGGCGGGHDNVGEATDTPRGETVFTPIVGALDRAQGVEHVAADHNRVLDEALRDGEPRKEERR